jgi:hypothetical protein
VAGQSHPQIVGAGSQSSFNVQVTVIDRVTRAARKGIPAALGRQFEQRRDANGALSRFDVSTLTARRSYPLAGPSNAFAALGDESLWPGA